ncbi:Uu.00g017330.m01.CDS01 [Anthostomella pinea]|uniref:Uu.00g017330.m01.CDS01 n=1 Tax=Anthostomella pinea TaxID=933095 RepID=A0AAI8VYV4_9PEZI|nr:Uu.00g017330.m01.CDS01 [Anthostomella pinea]
MSGFYQQYSPSIAGREESPGAAPQDVQYQSQHPQAQLGNIGAPIPNPYQNLGYFTGFPDPIPFQAPKTQGNRSRKKSTPGMDHVKHRRTRSGCFTCRSRRVKCDETRPTCERCRKGKRDCVYPEPAAQKGSAGPGSSKDTASQSQGTSPESSQDEAEEFDQDAKLEPILDEEEPDEGPSQPPRSFSRLRRVKTMSTLNLRKISTRRGSETPSLEATKSSSPSVSTGTTASFTTPFHMVDPALQSSAPHKDWSHLPLDLQSYLGYFCENITHYNYGMVNDPDDFFREILPGIALQSGNDALLYALVGFSVYHRSVQNPNGKIEDFLRYYNKSVTLLLSCLKGKDNQNIATLLTILQLATIEEYLGDWVNLMGHQKAALEIVTRFFTPQTAQQSPTSRMLLTWYARFDVFIGMMGGFDTGLPREYFSMAVQFSQEQVDQDPEDVGWRIEVQAAALRLISLDMSDLYARSGRGEMPSASFAEEHRHITYQLREWKNQFDPALTNPKFLVTDFPHRDVLGQDDIVDPYKAGFLYNHPFFPSSILMVEWHSINVMHQSKETPMSLQEPSDELRHSALAICEMFETIQLWPSTPNGALIIVQAGLAIATLFIPRDARHHMWIRRRFALLESLG